MIGSNGKPAVGSDDAKIATLTTALVTNDWFQAEGTDEAKTQFVLAIGQCLTLMLGREPTIGEVERVARGEM